MSKPESRQPLSPDEVAAWLQDYDILPTPQRLEIAQVLFGRHQHLSADQILALVKHLSEELHMTTVWVTHDLGVIARLVDRVVVMYGGYIVEDAPVDQIFYSPQHPYTRRLLASLPNPADDSRPPLAQIPGRPPLPSESIKGCPFRPRCEEATEACRELPPLEPRREGAVACWVPPERWS